MAQDTEPARIDPPPPAAILEWGAADESPRAALPKRLTVLTRIVGDRLLIAVVTALGGVALFASLISEWQTTVINMPDIGAGADSRQFTTNVADLAGWGGGYLAGLMLLCGAMTLVLLGPSTVRPVAVLITLSTGGVLLALLVAVLSDLDERSRLSNILELSLPSDLFHVAYGRGVWCAFVGVSAVTLGAYLSGRQLTRPTSPADAPVEAPEDLAEAPLDLTVTSTTPFTQPAQTTGFAPPTTNWARPIDGAR